MKPENYASIDLTKHVFFIFLFSPLHLTSATLKTLSGEEGLGREWGGGADKGEESGGGQDLGKFEEKRRNVVPTVTEKSD